MDPELNQGADGSETDPQQQPEAGEPQERQLTPRELAMNAIVVVREEEEPAATTPAQQPAQGVPEQGAQQQAEVDQVALQAGGPQVLSQDLDKVMVKVKLYGQESEVSVAELQRQYQINGAAEVRLQEANELLKKAKTQAAPPVGVAPQDGAPDSSNTLAPKGAGEVARDIVGALLKGDDATAVSALEQVLEGRQQELPTPIDPDQLAAQLTPAIRQQIVNESALDAFMAANADLMADPHLVDLTSRYVDAEMATGKAYPDALAAAGQQTRAWIAKLGGGKPTVDPQQTSRDKKLERKAAMDNLPALNKTASSMQEPPQTTSSVIAEMRRSRGLPD